MVPCSLHSSQWSPHAISPVPRVRLFRWNAHLQFAGPRSFRHPRQCRFHEQQRNGNRERGPSPPNRRPTRDVAFGFLLSSLRLIKTDVSYLGATARWVRQCSVRFGARTPQTSTPSRIDQSCSRLPQYSGPAHRMSGQFCQRLRKDDSCAMRPGTLMKPFDPNTVSNRSLRVSRRFIASPRRVVRPIRPRGNKCLSFLPPGH